MALVFISLVRTYQENSITFLTETTYLEWNTSFPSVSVCQISGADMPFDQRDNKAMLEFFITDLLFFSGSCYACQYECFSCSKVNISQIIQKLRKPCSKILSSCKWNEKEFNCCDQFLPLETEYGVCFSFNSLHTKNPNEELLNLQMNRETGTGKLSIETIEDVRVYIHGPEEVPFINAESNYMKDILLGEHYEILFNVVEIDNDARIIELPLWKRKCRFPWELPNNLRVHRLYSYSTCLVQCHADNHFRICNCTHHLMPYYNKRSYCDIEGLKCLTNNFETVNRLHSKGSDKPGLSCDCYPSCTEPEYNIVSKEKSSNYSSSGITIEMQSLPTSRFKRVVVKNILDLVVSIGGAAGFFIGASLLTVVEIIYIYFIRT
ncbi:sodium channel protein Nach [Dendroctonus ponderosae]|uniref:sodium channel protein Nach n=1 Tax=Dendroctonus ponderosae TaxID=77166 RepID=UPI0020352CA6|nr:sodium channel protein Nach [Dendroctonus ponderosae]